MFTPKVDLHVHSYFSDGTMSPAEIAEEAEASQVGVLAVADHNTLEGSMAIREECFERGIRYIPAVEIDALEKGANFHVLAYGFDMLNLEFRAFLSHASFLLDELSVKLVEAMQRDYDSISLKDFMEYTYDRRLGGWKALHYFVEKGLTSSLREGVRLYGRYSISYDVSGYSTISAIAYRIHKAGGYAVLAHPGELIDSENIDDFSAEVKRIVVDCGLDGVECYYPSHSELITKACVEICTEKNLLITAGSDCHGNFGRAKVGQMGISLDKLVLKDLLHKTF